MLFKINETNEVKELSWHYSGSQEDWIIDLMVDFDADFEEDNENDCYTMNKEDFNWWENIISEMETARERFRGLVDDDSAEFENMPAEFDLADEPDLERHPEMMNRFCDELEENTWFYSDECGWMPKFNENMTITEFDTNLFNKRSAHDGEMDMRGLSKKAYDHYSNTDLLTVYKLADNYYIVRYGDGGTVYESLEEIEKAFEAEKDADDEKYSRQERWAERNEVISKSYKLNKSLTEEFSQACKNAGQSQASALTELMEKYISQNK